MRLRIILGMVFFFSLYRTWRMPYKFSGIKGKMINANMLNILYRTKLTFIVVIVSTYGILMLFSCKDKSSPKTVMQDSIVVQGLQIVKSPLIQRVVGSGFVTISHNTVPLQANDTQGSIPLLVHIAVAERFVPFITKQDAVHINIASLNMTINTAKVRTIGDTIGKNMESIPVTVAWEADIKKDASLIEAIPDKVVSEVTIIVDERKAQYPIVPKSVVLKEDNMYYVLLASRPLENSTIYRVKVALGDEFAGKIEIIDGIVPDDEGIFPVSILSRLTSALGTTVKVDVIGETGSF